MHGNIQEKLQEIVFLPLKRQPHKMVKHTQVIRRQKLTNCLSVFDHFAELAFEGLSKSVKLNMEKQFNVHETLILIVRTWSMFSHFAGLGLKRLRLYYRGVLRFCHRIF